MADSKYTVQDLQDNLAYLEETKRQIKQAIIDKGQSVSNEDTFRSYVNKIGAIETGIDTSDATATTNDLIYPKIAYTNGTKIVGAITEKTEPLGVTPYKIRTSIEGVSDLVACNEDDIVLFTSPENLYVYKYDTVNKVFNLLKAIPNTTMYNKRIKITNCFYNNNDWCILITYSNYTVRSTNYVKDVAHIAELKYINGEYTLTDNITQVGTDHYWLNPEFVYNKNNNLYLATYYRSSGHINQYICIYKLNYIPFSGECSYVTNISDTCIYDYGYDYYNEDAHFVYHSSYITSSGEMILFSGFYGDNSYGANMLLRLNSDLTSIVHKITANSYIRDGRAVAYDNLYINLYFYAELIRYTIYKWDGTNYVKINEIDTNYPKGSDLTKRGAFTIKLVQNMLIFTYLNSNNQCLSYTAFIENDTLRFGETYDDPMNYPITRENSDDIQTTSKFAMIKYGSDIKLFGIDTNGTRRLALTDANYTYYNTYNSDVVASDILVDKTAYNNQGIIKGSMPNNGELNYTPSTEEQIIPAGYTSGGTIAAVDASIDENIIPENIKKDVSIFGITGTLESNDLSDYFNLEPPNLIDNYSYGFNDLILKIPDNLDLSQTKHISSFFEGLSGIKHIPMLDITKFTDTSRMFYGCHNLIDIPQLDTSNAKDMSLMFQSCWKLKTVPLLDTSNAKNMSHIFQECRSLKNIPAFNTSNNTDFTLFIGIAEGTEGSLIEFPSIDTSKGKKFWHMCYKQKSLVTVPVLDLSGVTTISNNLADMFGLCTSLSDDSLNNIMASLVTVADTGTTNKTLSNVGLSSAQANKCKTLSNYSAFTAAGWTTGY